MSKYPLSTDSRIWEAFKFFWDIRRPFWLASEIELVEDILEDPDFISCIKKIK